MGSFRRNLRNELDYQDLTVKELAAKSAVSKGALDTYLGRQASMPPADVAVRIASSLGVTVEYLVNSQESGAKSLSYSSPRKRSILRIFDELDENDQEFMLDIAKLLKSRKANRPSPTLPPLPERY
jgi:transcriptional regulator with XRE-family HTH domain